MTRAALVRVHSGSGLKIWSHRGGEGAAVGACIPTRQTKGMLGRSSLSSVESRFPAQGMVQPIVGKSSHLSYPNRPPGILKGLLSHESRSHHTDN